MTHRATMMRRAAVVVAVLVAGTARAATELHYGPLENLEKIDVVRLNTARKTIDMTAATLTDDPVIGALTAAAYRGVKIRLFFDGKQSGMPAMAPDGPMGRLFAAPNVTIKAKRTTAPPMSMKSYCVDGRVFRTGSANFTPASLREHDNDLLLFEDPALCSDFTINFDQLWDSADAE